MNQFTEQFLMKSRNVNKFIEDVINFSMQQAQVDDSFRISHWLATFLWHNYSGVYRLDALEETLIEKFDFFPESQTYGLLDELHVITEVYSGGGHTPLMRALVLQLPTIPDVLVTEGEDIPTYADILKISVERIKIIQNKNFLNKLNQVTNIILNYKKVALHIHPNDLITAIGLRLAKKINPSLEIYLINHADHCFSVGLGIADYIFEVSANGWGLRDEKNTVSKSSFIGLPIRIENLSKTNVVRDPYLMITGGASHKFRPIKGKSLQKILDAILKSNNLIKLLIVGAKWHDWWWWWLIIKYQKRIQRFSFLNRTDYYSLMNKSSMYIDSYPVGGGTAFPEALMSGVNVFGLKDGTFGSTCADTLRSESEKELLVNFEKQFSGDLVFMENQRRIRSQCFKFHDIDSVLSRIEFTIKNSNLVLPPDEFIEELPIRYFEIAWRNQSKVNLPKFLKYLNIDQSINLIRIYYKNFGLMNFWVSCYLMRLYFLRVLNICKG
jgi:hypothetical protein